MASLIIDPTMARSFLSSGTSNDVGVVLFQVPSSELKVVVDIKADARWTDWVTG